MQWANGSHLSAMDTLKLGIAKLGKDGDSKTIGRSYLLLGRLSEIVGMPSSEVIEQYKNVQEKCGTWEKGYFFLGKYNDSIILSMVPSASDRDTHDSESLLDTTLVNAAITNYLLALKYGARYLFHSLPRVLTLWSMVRERKDRAHIQSVDSTLNNYRLQLPPFIWLSSLSQLKSLYLNRNFEGCNVLFEILNDIIKAFPAQSVWRFMDFLLSEDKEKKDTM